MFHPQRAMHWLGILARVSWTANRPPLIVRRVTPLQTSAHCNYTPRKSVDNGFCLIISSVYNPHPTFATRSSQACIAYSVLVKQLSNSAVNTTASARPNTDPLPWLYYQGNSYSSATDLGLKWAQDLITSDCTMSYTTVITCLTFIFPYLLAASSCAAVAWTFRCLPPARKLFQFWQLYSLLTLWMARG